MKITKGKSHRGITKIGAALLLAMALAGAGLTSCSNGLLEEPSEVQASSRNGFSDMSAEDKEALKTLVKDGVKAYQKEKAEEDAKKEKPFVYKGFKGALSKFSGSAAKELIKAQHFPEGSTAEYLAGVAARGLDAGMKFVDNALNGVSGGLYGVALEIFFPEEDKPNPQIAALQQSVDQIQESVDALGVDIMNINDTVTATSARQALFTRIEELNKVSSKYWSFLQEMKRLQNGEGNLDYKGFLELNQFLKNSSFKSAQDMRDNIKEFLKNYMGVKAVSTSYPEMYTQVAEWAKAWRPQSVDMVRSLLDSELRTGTEMYSVASALLNPNDNANLYTHVMVGYAMSSDSNIETLYNEAIRPMETNIYSKINEAKFNELMDAVEEWRENLSAKDAEALYNKLLAVGDDWNEINGLYDEYVQAILDATPEYDREGTVTCNIKSDGYSKHTFANFMGTVDYKDEFSKDKYKSGFNSDCSNWYGCEKRISNCSEWKRVHDCGWFMDSDDVMFGKEVYESILDFYKTRGIAVTNEKGEEVDLTLKNILTYEAGIKNVPDYITYYNKSHGAGFKLEEVDWGDTFTYGARAAKASVFYLDANSTSPSEKTFSVLDYYVYMNKNVQHFAGANYPGHDAKINSRTFGFFLDCSNGRSVSVGGDGTKCITCKDGTKYSWNDSSDEVGTTTTYSDGSEHYQCGDVDIWTRTY